MTISVFKGNTQFAEKVSLEPLINFTQNHHRSWKYYKSCYFLNFYSLKVIKNTQLILLLLGGTVLFNIFIRQTLTEDFWGLHKNINCAFPLSNLS